MFAAAVAEIVFAQGLIGGDVDAAVGALDHVAANTTRWLTTLDLGFSQCSLEHAIEQPDDQADNDESDQVHGAPIRNDISALYRLTVISANHSAFAPRRALFHNRRPFFDDFQAIQGER